MPKRLNSILCLFVLASALTVAHAEIYKWTDANGNVHFSDRKSVAHRTKKVEVKVNSIAGVSHGPSNINTGKKVVMYSAVWCGQCKRARRFFKDNKISFTEYDIEKSTVGAAHYKRLRGRGVPIILVGKKRMDGFSPNGFAQMYAGKPQPRQRLTF